MQYFFVFFCVKKNKDNDDAATGVKTPQKKCHKNNVNVNVTKKKKMMKKMKKEEEGKKIFDWFILIRKIKLDSCGFYLIYSLQKFLVGHFFPHS